MTYLVFILVILAIVFYRKTSAGLAFSSIGENPRAADAAGISVYKHQWVAIIVNGVMGGIGGAVLVLVQLGKVFREYDFRARLYCACCGHFRPVYTAWYSLGAALVFGGANALQIRLQAMGVPLFLHRHLLCFHTL